MPVGLQTIAYNAFEGCKYKFTISDYDEDFHTYTLNEARFTACYVQVPQTEREYFKNNFSTAKITPTYSVKDDTLAIVALTVQIGQKTYKTPQDVADDGSTLAMELPPLEFNLSQEQEAAQPKVATYDKTLDEQIPQSRRQAPNTFVVAIGNENYQLVPTAQFAGNDLDIFARYCQENVSPVSTPK